MTQDPDCPAGAQAPGPFRCQTCNKILGWREVRAGQCQGHLLTDLMSEAYVPCEVREGVAREVRDMTQKHKMDRKYGRWVSVWGRYAETFKMWLP